MKKNVRKLGLMVTGLFFVFHGFAQESHEAEESSFNPWFIGGTGGAYFAHNSSASFYNGTGTYGINWIFGIQHYSDQIKAQLGLDQQAFYLGEVPENMTYRPGFTIGLNGGYRFNKASNFFFDLNITTFKLKDVYTIYVDDPINFEPTIYPQVIIGEEKRLHINIGYRHLFGGSQTRAFLEVAGSFNDFEVMSNTISVGNISYNLIRPVIPNNPHQNIQFQTGGSGIGGVAGAGIHYKMNNDFSFDFGLHARMDKVVLNPNIENVYKPQFVAFTRIIFK